VCLVAGATISRLRARWSRVPWPVTNTSVNPARSTGPAIFAGGEYLGQIWLFWVAPIIGAVIAGLVTRWLPEPIQSQAEALLSVLAERPALVG
jgi:aquaporin Z